MFDGGIGVVAMLNRTNFMALVGGGRNPVCAPNKVILWDDAKRVAVVELEFNNEVKSVCLRSDKFVVCLSHKIHVYTFSPSPVKLCTFDTVENNQGAWV